MMRHFLKTKAAEIRERIASGQSCPSIADHFGVSTTSIYLIRDNQIHPGLGPDVSKLTRQAKTFENVRVLREMAETMTLSEASDALDLSPANVYKYSREYGIHFQRKTERRPKGIRVIQKMKKTLMRAGFTAEQIEKFKNG